VLGGVEEKQVRSAIVMTSCELTLMNSDANSLEHTQKRYQRYLEPQTLRRGTTYEKFASDLHRKFQGTNWPATSWLRRPFSSECELFSFVLYYLALLWRCFCMIWEFFNFEDGRLALRLLTREKEVFIWDA